MYNCVLYMTHYGKREVTSFLCSCQGNRCPEKCLQIKQVYSNVKLLKSSTFLYKFVASYGGLHRLVVLLYIWCMLSFKMSKHKQNKYWLYISDPNHPLTSLNRVSVWCDHNHLTNLVVFCFWCLSILVPIDPIKMCINMYLHIATLFVHFF